MTSDLLKYFLGFVVLLFSCNNRSQDILRIAAASSLRYPFEEIVSEYEKMSGSPCQLITSSSGKLSAQIIEGAPYDIFYAANLAYSEAILDSGRGHTKDVICKAPIVLWSAVTTGDLSLINLLEDEIAKIAMPNPIVAPYGVAAKQALVNTGLYEKISEKLVYGESVSQTNQFIISRVVQAGFTSKSVVLSDQAKDIGSWVEINKSLYDPIVISRVFIGEVKLNEATRNFDEFVSRGRGREILEQYGFEVTD